MGFPWRRKPDDEMLERLRRAAPECSGVGMEEENESKVEQAPAQKGAPVKKDVCCKCHLTFGLAEKRVAIDSTRVMHEDCYEKHLRELSERAERLNRLRLV